MASTLQALPGGVRGVVVLRAALSRLTCDMKTELRANNVEKITAASSELLSVATPSAAFPQRC